MTDSILTNTNDATRRRAILSREGGAGYDPRNTYEQFCYPHNLSFGDYHSRYCRGDLSKRICDAYPNACWAMPPVVTDDDDKESETEFETAFADVAKRLQLFSRFRNADVLANIGAYSIIVVGVSDGKDVAKPLGSVNGIDDLIYLTAYNQQRAVITAYEDKPSSPRFGLPKVYRVTTGGYKTDNTEGATQMGESTFDVHHSRVIHICENNLDNELFGIPRLMPIYNRIVDLEKILGGSAELFWLNGRGGLQVNTTDQTQNLDVDNLREQLDDYTDNMRRVIATKATEVKVIEHTVPSPDKQFEVLISAIAGTTGIPQRLLIGSERGELASSQDANAWIQRVAERQAAFCEVRLVRQFTDLCIAHGILPKPKDDKYEVQWADLMQLGEAEKATIAHTQVQALAGYLNAGGSMLIPPRQFVEDILGLEYREDEVDELILDDTDDDDDDKPPAKGKDDDKSKGKDK